VNGDCIDDLPAPLGGIDVEVAEGDGPWRAVGSFDEARPIAGDLRVVPFEAQGLGPVRVRLRLVKGHWRLDAVALARLGPEVAPARLEPSRGRRPVGRWAARVVLSPRGAPVCQVPRGPQRRSADPP